MEVVGWEACKCPEHETECRGVFLQASSSADVDSRSAGVRACLFEVVRL